ncbi:MAG TPA: FAD-binding oxidoreductase [Mycobacteriales bacterium]
MPLDASVVTDFVRSFAGTAVAPGDPRFAEVRAAAVWNGDIDHEPALIARPTTHDQVAEILAFARANGAMVTVRGGGHGFSGKLVAAGAVMIDLSEWNGVRVDAGSRRAYVECGASLAMLDAATAEHGLAVVGGTVSHTGVAGLTLAGGMGWLTRSQGLSCDNLVGATLVTADGRVVTVSEDSDPELMWGLRGAGANFGVVTELVFRLHDVNPMVNLGMFFWPAAEAREALRWARTGVPALPDGMAALMAGLCAPPAPFVPAEHQGTVGFAVMIASWGDAAAHAAAIEPLRARNPLFELVTPMPYVALQQMLDESAPWGVRAYEKGIYLDDLSDEVIDILVEGLPRKKAPLSFLPIFRLDGAFSDVADDATAFGGTRRPHWALSTVALDFDPETLAQDREWVRGMWSALRAHAHDDGTYVNFSTDIDDKRVMESYGAEKYARLAALKAQWDPQNVFCNNANIRPGTITIPEPRAVAVSAAEPV